MFGTKKTRHLSSREASREIHDSLTDLFEERGLDERYSVNVKRSLFTAPIVEVRDTHELRAVFEIVVYTRRGEICVYNLYGRRARVKKYFMTDVGVRNAVDLVMDVLIKKLAAEAA